MPTVVVTGSGRGIGRAVAVRFAREGWNVVVNAKRGREEAEGALRLVREAGGSGVVVLADVATREGCRQVIDAAVEKFGGLDVLLNNAGLGLFTLFLNADDRLIEKQLEVSLKSVIYCSQEAARVDGGRLHNKHRVDSRHPALCRVVYLQRGQGGSYKPHAGVGGGASPTDKSECGRPRRGEDQDGRQPPQGPRHGR